MSVQVGQRRRWTHGGRWEFDVLAIVGDECWIRYDDPVPATGEHSSVLPLVNIGVTELVPESPIEPGSRWTRKDENRYGRFIHLVVADVIDGVAYGMDDYSAEDAPNDPWQKVVLRVDVLRELHRPYKATDGPWLSAIDFAAGSTPGGEE